MNKDSISDYLGFTVIRLIGPLIRVLPLSLSLFIGRTIGRLFYCLSLKHRAIVYSNIRKAFGDRYRPREIKKITRDFFLNFGQNLIEVFLIPIIDKKYLSRYVSVDGFFHIEEAFKSSRGVIILPVHEGSWEISNMFCANMLGASYNMVVQDQRHPRMNKLLNDYRLRTGCKLIESRSQVRYLIEALKNNQAVSITVDQGGREGVKVKFFGRYASVSAGAVRLALKYGAALIPVFAHRVRGSYIHIDIKPQFSLSRTQDTEQDVKDNLERIMRIFEDYILRYPKEYLWLYKIWKYSPERSILILNDQKAGHLRQSEALAELVKKYLYAKDMRADIEILDVEFKNKFSRQAIILSSLLAGKYHCQGCAWCLQKFLTQNSYQKLISFKPDIIISCGSSLAPLNYILSRENLAKSLVLMRPSILGTHKFDLVVMPRHDRPKFKRNIAITETALNLINDDYLLKVKNEVLNYLKAEHKSIDERKIVLGLLLGGDTKSFSIPKEALSVIIQGLNKFVTRHNAELLLSTSRRTSKENEDLVKSTFSGNEHCKFLIIANEKNIPEAVGGILALSKIVLVSPESISMISEAVSSKKYVVVFDLKGLSRKHRDFLSRLSAKKYIYLTAPHNLGNTLEDILENKPAINIIDDKSAIREKLDRIL